MKIPPSEFESLPLSFRDFIMYFIPGAVLLAAVLYSKSISEINAILEWDSTYIIFVLLVLSYIMGQFSYITRLLLLKTLRKIFGDPKEYFIVEPFNPTPKGQDPNRISPKVWRYNQQMMNYRDVYLPTLEDFWGDDLYRTNKKGERKLDYNLMFALSAKLVSDMSPHNRYRYNRWNALRNMYGGLVFSVWIFAFVLAYDIDTRFFALLFGFLSLLLIRNFCAFNRDMTSTIYRGFLYLHRSGALKDDGADQLPFESHTSYRGAVRVSQIPRVRSRRGR